MGAITGAWAALPEVPWATEDGTTYKALGARVDRLLEQVEAGFPGADADALTLLAAQVRGMRDGIRSLVRSELVVNRVYDAGVRDERARFPRRRGHLRRVEDPG